LECRVAERTAQLEALNKELEAFSYSVSHDLRAPLRHIAAFADIVRQEAGSSLNEKSARHLEIVCAVANRMGTLVDDLLAFSRTGRAEMYPRPVRMDELVDEVLQELKRDTEGRNIEWKVEPLPHVMSDRSMLKQVWVNLLSNAIKYTRQGERAEIQVGGRNHEDEFEFWVRDNGAGFDMQYARKLFGVFERLHQSEEFEGTGIGLANVQRIISRHGGRTWAEGKVGEGAIFWFTLPKSSRPS
jgi:light-regulated signal transduction histidine kinase (bacteriophytochrome)